MNKALQPYLTESIDEEFVGKARKTLDSVDNAGTDISFSKICIEEVQALRK